MANGGPIYIGYQWDQRLTITGITAPFPSGVTLRADIRRRPTDEDELITLTTSSGLTRVSDTSIDIQLTADETADFPTGTLFMDLIRTDTDPELHYGFVVHLTAVQPITRPVE